ncbi:hypothetical protein D3C76_1648470 [compost metagenome]
MLRHIEFQGPHAGFYVHMMLYIQLHRFVIHISYRMVFVLRKQGQVLQCAAVDRILINYLTLINYVLPV